MFKSADWINLQHTVDRRESAEYRQRREELQQAEIELMRQRERVAKMRRALPPGAAVKEDYVFQGGPTDLATGDEPTRNVRLSQLFTAPDRSLVIYHFMYGKQQKNACPMCTMWIDGFTGVAHHLAENVDFAVVAAVDLPTLREHGRRRGWHRLRLLSCGDNTFKEDFASEDKDGNQHSTVTVFTRDGDGTVRHFYTTHPNMSDEIDQRGIDLLCPVWHVLDLTPEGRDDWYAELEYSKR
jgi:predicted dithiol-disulfide oxidoreductase (DUF899 family)